MKLRKPDHLKMLSPENVLFGGKCDPYQRHTTAVRKFLHTFIPICRASTIFFTYTRAVTVFKLLHKIKQDSEETDDPSNNPTFIPDTLHVTGKKIKV